MCSFQRHKRVQGLRSVLLRLQGNCDAGFAEEGLSGPVAEQLGVHVVIVRVGMAGCWLRSLLRAVALLEVKSLQDSLHCGFLWQIKKSRREQAAKDHTEEVQKCGGGVWTLEISVVLVLAKRITKQDGKIVFDSAGWPHLQL